MEKGNDYSFEVITSSFQNRSTWWRLVQAASGLISLHILANLCIMTMITLEMLYVFTFVNAFLLAAVLE